MESANVGVVLFCPDLGFLDVKLATSNDRLRRFFKSGTFDPEAIHAAKQSIANRFAIERSAFRNIEDLDRFISTRANALSMTGSRPVKVLDPKEEMAALFRDLVGGRVRGAHRSEPRQALDAVFHRPEFAGRVEFDRTIRIPIIGKPFKAPYAYRNGVLNLVKPQEFPAHENSATATAMKLAVEGDLLWKHGGDTGEQAKLIVVPSFPPQSEGNDLPRRVISLFENYQIQTVSLDRIDEFAEHVRREAH